MGLIGEVQNCIGLYTLHPPQCIPSTHYFPSFLAFYIKIKSHLHFTLNENQSPKLDLRYTTIFCHLRFTSKSKVTCILLENENLPSKLDFRYTTICCHLRFASKSKVTCILHRNTNQRKLDLRYTTMGAMKVIYFQYTSLPQIMYC